MAGTQRWKQNRYSPNSITPTLRQSPRQVPDKVANLLWTQIMKVGNTNHVANFHDLCPRLCRELVPDFVADFLQTSRRVEMVCVCDFHDLCQRLSPKLHGFMICHRLCPRLSQRKSRRNGIWAHVMTNTKAARPRKDIKPRPKPD